MVETQGAGNLAPHPARTSSRVGLPLGAGDAADGLSQIRPSTHWLQASGPAASLAWLPRVEAPPGHGHREKPCQTEASSGWAPRTALELGQGVQGLGSRLRRDAAILPPPQAQHPDQLPVELAQQALTQGRIQGGALSGQQVHQAGC